MLQGKRLYLSNTPLRRSFQGLRPRRGLMSNQSGTGSLNNGLISFWKLGEASGTRADSIGSNNLTENGSVGQVAGPGGFNGASFNGNAANYLSILDNATLRTGTGACHRTCWINPTSLAIGMSIFSKDAAGGSGTNARYVNTGPGMFWLGRQAGGADCFRIQGTNDLTVATWFFLDFWEDGAGNAAVRINASNLLQTSGAMTNTLADETNPFQLGRDNSGSVANLNGGMLGFGFWNRKLLDSEVVQLFGAGTPLMPPF